MITPKLTIGTNREVLRLLVTVISSLIGTFGPLFTVWLLYQTMPDLGGETGSWKDSLKLTAFIISGMPGLVTGYFLSRFCDRVFMKAVIYQHRKVR